jgi:hypothetical protein
MIGNIIGDEEDLAGFIQRRTAEEREKIARAAAGFDAWRSALTDQDVEGMLRELWADGTTALARFEDARLRRPDEVAWRDDAETMSRESTTRWTDLDASPSASNFMTDSRMGVKEVAERVGALLGVDLLPTSSFVLTVDAATQSVTLSRTEDLDTVRMLYQKGEL